MPEPTTSYVEHDAEREPLPMAAGELGEVD